MLDRRLRALLCPLVLVAAPLAASVETSAQVEAQPSAKQGVVVRAGLAQLAKPSDTAGAKQAYARGARVILAGKVPLSASKAASLAEELRARGHWLAVIVGEGEAPSAGSLSGLAPATLPAWRRALGIELRAESDYGEDALDSTILITLSPKSIQLLLGKAYTDHDVGESDPRMIAPARAALRDGLRIDDAIRDTIARVDRRRAASRRLPWLIWGGAALTLLTLLGLAALASRRKARRAKQRYEEWSRRFDRQQGALVELKRWGEILSKNPRYRGQTKELAESIVEDVQHVALIRGGALEALDQAKDLIWPTGFAHYMNLVTAWRYNKALDVMSKAKVRFDADGDLARALRGERLEGASIENIWKGAREVRRESRSFEQLVQELSTRAERVDAVVQKIKTCSQTVDASLSVLEARSERFEHAALEFETLSQADASCALPAIRDALLPALRARHAQMRSVADSDPVTAVENGDAAEVVLQRGEETLEQAVQLHQDAVPQLRGAGLQLEASEVASSWLELRIAELFRTANDAFAQLANFDVPEDRPQLFDGAASALQDAARALDIARSRAQVGLPALRRVRAAITREREAIARELGISGDILLCEDGAAPDEYLDRAQHGFDETLRLLSEGALDESFDTASAAHGEVEAAERILTDTRDALARWSEKLESVTRRRARLEDEALPEHDEILRAMRVYSDRAMAHENSERSASRSLFDNARDARADTERAAEHIATARRLYGRGALLQADHELDSASSLCELAQARLREIRDRRQLLEATEERNRSRVQRLEALERKLERSRFEEYVTRTTSQKLLDAGATLRVATREHGDARRDPFERARLLDDAQGSLHAARSCIDADRTARAEARRSLELARDLLRRLEERCREARHDDIPDSQATRDILTLTPRRLGELDELERRLAKAHSDWIEIDREIDDVHSQTFELLNRLQREIESGARALEELRRAGQAVREAASYEGRSFGLRVPGNPGRSDHVRAKRSLERGDYAAATRAARSALREARDAIADAERELAFQRRSTKSVRDIVRDVTRGGGLGGFRINFDVEDFAEEVLDGISQSWSGSERYRHDVEVPRARRAKHKREDSSFFDPAPAESRRDNTDKRGDDSDTSSGDDGSGFGVSFDW